VKMTATTASDRSDVEYFFECIEGGGQNSAWQESPSYEAAGLIDGATYIYRVRCRDKSMNQNATEWSLPFRVTVGNLLVDVDVEDLPTGSLSTWKNSGSLGGEFNNLGAPTVEMVKGRKAVTFHGDDSMLATFTAPAAITGGNPFSIAVWAQNPEIDSQECLVLWAHRGTEARCGQMNFGNNPSWGVVTHWSGGDMGFNGGLPGAGEWHHIVLTYEGGEEGIEKVYVDGEMNTQEPKTLNLWTGDQIRIGSSESDHWFTGSMASVKIYNYCLTQDDVRALVSANE